MDRVLLLRFPHIGSKIFEQIDDQGLQKCKFISASWEKFILQQKFYWIRIITNIVQELNPGYTNYLWKWEKILKRLNVKTLVNFAKHIQVQHEKWETIHLDIPLNMLLTSYACFTKSELLAIVKDTIGFLESECRCNQQKHKDT